MKAAILTRGGEVAPCTPEELGEWVKNELKKWPPIIKTAGIKAG